MKCKRKTTKDCIITTIPFQFFGFSHCLQLFIASWKSSTCRVISKKLYFARSFAVASRKTSWASAVDSKGETSCVIGCIVNLVDNSNMKLATYCQMGCQGKLFCSETPDPNVMDCPDARNTHECCLYHLKVHALRDGWNGKRQLRKLASLFRLLSPSIRTPKTSLRMLKVVKRTMIEKMTVQIGSR